MAAELPQEGWYRDPADPLKRRWWDGQEWSDIVAPAVVNPGAASPARPVVVDGAALPYASDSSAGTLVKTETSDTDESEGSRLSRVRVLQMAVALVAIVATAAVVFVDRTEEQAGPIDVPVTTVPSANDEQPPTTEAPATTEAPTTTVEETEVPEEPAAETAAATEPIEAPTYREAYEACQVILDGSSIGAGGMDYQTFRDIDAVVTGPITELRFSATDGGGATETYLCRTLYDGAGDVMVGRLYLDLQNVL